MNNIRFLPRNCKYFVTTWANPVFTPLLKVLLKLFTEGFPARLTWSQIGKDSLYDLFLMNDPPVT